MVLRRYITKLARETVVVHTTDRSSFRGVLMAVHKDCIVLVHARLLSTTGTEKIDGECVIPRDNVAWLQHLATEGSDES